MAIELSTDFMKQREADQAYARLLEVQERLSTREGAEEKIPTSEWTEDQHAEWDAAWQAWRTAAAEVQEAIAEAGESRLAVEMAVKKTVRPPQPEGEAA